MRGWLQKASWYFILFMAVSFLGWAVETLFFVFLYGRFYDRGFMTLPFCTIYGFSFLLVYFLIGTPETGGVLPRQTPGKRRSPPVYFLLSALLPTGLELMTGYFFHRVFGIRLWSYSAYPFHFHGYICLEYTLLWGMLIPVCMKYIFAPLKERVFSIEASRARMMSGVLALMALVDWSINFASL